LSFGVRFRRGGLADLSMAMSKHVSLSFLPTVDFLKKQGDALRAEGIEIAFHDDEGRDLELNPVASDETSALGSPTRGNPAVSQS